MQIALHAIERELTANNKIHNNHEITRINVCCVCVMADYDKRPTCIRHAMECRICVLCVLYVHLSPSSTLYSIHVETARWLKTMNGMCVIIYLFSCGPIIFVLLHAANIVTTCNCRPIDIPTEARKRRLTQYTHCDGAWLLFSSIKCFVCLFIVAYYFIVNSTPQHT